MRAALVACLVAAACGGGDAKKPTTPTRVEPVVGKPPGPPPVCIQGGDATGAIGGATGSDTGAEFCVSDGSNQCFSVDLASGKYTKLDAPPTPQPAAIDPGDVKVDTTATAIEVCKGKECKTVSPKVPKPDKLLAAVANESIAVVMLGDTLAGRVTAEVWDVARNKKLTSIKYAKSDFVCGVPKLLGSTIYISASVCAGPAARAGLYDRKGKKLADVGGKDFGSYGEVAVQVKDNLWAFLEESGAMVALQDVVTGKVAKTIALTPLWRTEGDAKPVDSTAMGTPGESALVRGGDDQLLVIAGSPSTGSVGIIDVISGELKVVRAPACK